MDEVRERKARRGTEPHRVWAWLALISTAVIGVSFLPTWGFSLLLWPISAAFTVAASFYRRDGVYWCGAGLNALLLPGFVLTVRELEVISTASLG
jgi:hypothetical protein